MKRKRVLGITGGVGSGKSTVLEYLAKQYGALCLYCDEIAREEQRRGGSCYGPMLALFGEDFLDEEGEFDRKKVAGAVFADPDLLRRLNACVHPAVMARVKERIEECFASGREDALAVVEAALLIESGYGRICDEIWYVYVPEEIRISRLMESRGYSREKCLQIFASQKGEAFFRANTALTIDNGSANREETFHQIDRGLKEHGFLYDSQRQQR